MSAEVLSTHTPALFNAAVTRAADLLRAGGVVALPTETVYGLAANALDADAVAAIFKIKGRPPQNPIIVHVADVGMAKQCVAEWPQVAERLASAFWPGPLTLVLPRAKEIPDVVTSGGATVGVRWPSHPFIQAVIRKCGFPLAAPSANPSNHLSPTNVEHVQKLLGDRLSLVVDGGQSQVGIESTVLDLTTTSPRVLRPGMIHESVLKTVIGNLEPQASGGDHGAPRSPGLFPKHYAPRAKLILAQWRDDADLASHIRGGAAHSHVIAHSRIPSAERFAGPPSDFSYTRKLPISLEELNHEHLSPQIARGLRRKLP